MIGDGHAAQPDHRVLPSMLEEEIVVRLVDAHVGVAVVVQIVVTRDEVLAPLLLARGHPSRPNVVVEPPVPAEEVLRSLLHVADLVRILVVSVAIRRERSCRCHAGDPEQRSR